MHKKILTMLLFVSSNLWANVVDCDNKDEQIFSFKTKKSKYVRICQGKEHLQYKFGTEKKLEFTFPTQTKDSFEKFQFKYYMRGGGPQNEGMELRTLVFKNDDFEYQVFQEYYSPSNTTDVGVRVTNLKTKKETIIAGLKNSIKGNLSILNDDERIKKIIE